MAAKPDDTKALLRKLAHAHANVVDGVACAGTKLESRTYSAGAKTFLHVGNAEPTVIRFKLASLAASAKKAGVDVGTGGWCKLVLTAGNAPPKALASWIAESYSIASGTGSTPAKAKKRR